MTGIGSAVATDRESDSSLVALEDLLVSIDFECNIAYVAYEDESVVRWGEISRADGELLVRMGARAHIHLASTTASKERAIRDQRWSA